MYPPLLGTLSLMQEHFGTIIPNVSYFFVWFVRCSKSELSSPHKSCAVYHLGDLIVCISNTLLCTDTCPAHRKLTVDHIVVYNAETGYSVVIFGLYNPLLSLK